MFKYLFVAHKKNWKRQISEPLDPHCWSAKIRVKEKARESYLQRISREGPRKLLSHYFHSCKEGNDLSRPKHNQKKEEEIPKSRINQGSHQPECNNIQLPACPFVGRLLHKSLNHPRFYTTDLYLLQLFPSRKELQLCSKALHYLQQQI